MMHILACSLEMFILIVEVDKFSVLPLIAMQYISDCSLVKSRLESRVSSRFIAKSYSMHVRSSKRWPFGKSSPHGLFVHCQAQCIDDVYLSQFTWVRSHSSSHSSQLVEKGSIPISCTCRPMLQSWHTLANRSCLHGLHMHGQLSGQMHWWSFPYKSCVVFLIHHLKHVNSLYWFAILCTLAGCSDALVIYSLAHSATKKYWTTTCYLPLCPTMLIFPVLLHSILAT